MAKTIVIAERDNIAAVMENDRVSEFFIHRGDVLLGDVYLAKVDNILPSIEAAFVNVGSDKMGFLHTQDVIGAGTLTDKLKPKQKIIVQVTKEPTGHKGPRVTMAISLPGRFLVLMPYEKGVNVSKKITSPKERARLKSVVSLLKPVGMGVIVRTEAEGQTDSEIQEDLEILLEKWNTIVTAAETVEAPNLLSRDQDLLYRVIREACTDDVEQIIVDTGFAMHRAQQLLTHWNMNKNIEVTLYKGSEPLLIASNIHKEITAALQTKVNLPCGGYLFVQTTEALSVIDVNSGKFTSSATQDETILKTNLEAVDEIARQLKLRNIGGMIIIDFIDMSNRADKIKVLEHLELALEDDKSKPQVGQLSDLGLVELTRHRQGQSLAEIFTKKCQACNGTGQIIQEFNFASSVAEGEYRSKAAKLKIPQGNFNKQRNNLFNRKQNNSNPSLVASGKISERPEETAAEKITENHIKKHTGRGKFLPKTASIVKPSQALEEKDVVKNPQSDVSFEENPTIHEASVHEVKNNKTSQAELSAVMTPQEEQKSEKQKPKKRSSSRYKTSKKPSEKPVESVLTNELSKKEVSSDIEQTTKQEVKFESPAVEKAPLVDTPKKRGRKPSKLTKKSKEMKNE